MYLCTPLRCHVCGLILTVPLVPSLTGLNDGCPWGLLTNGFTDRLAFILLEALLPLDTAPDPLASCINVSIAIYRIWTMSIAKGKGRDSPILMLWVPRVGPGHPLPPCPSFSPFYFSHSFIGFTYFLLLSIPSLSTRIVPLRFQAGGRRRRPNLG